MRIGHAALLLAVSTYPALAQRAPVIVIPGRPDVPVLMNGVDVSWAVIEGEFGLDRPGEVTPTVIYRFFPVAVPYYPGSYQPGYFPSTGRRPGYGRSEVVPPPGRPLPPPAPSYRRSWSSRSAPGPVTDYAPFNAPPVVLWRGGGRNGHEGREGAQQGPSNGPANGPGNRPGGPGGPGGPGNDRP